MQVSIVNAVFVSVAAALSLLMQDGPLIVVGENVHVSAGREHIVHDELMIAADPNNADRLLVCAMATPPERRRAFDIVYGSTDGGRTWRPVVDLFDGSTGDLDRPWTVDVDCTFGSHGEAYFVASAIKPPEGGPAQAWIFRSPDGGQNWLPRVVVPHVFDRPYLAVDRTGGPYRGRLYLTFATRFLSLDSDIARGIGDDKTPAGGVALSISLDGGKTFALTTQQFALPTSDRIDASPGSQTLLLSDGTLLIFIKHSQLTDDTEGELKLMRSTDGGRSLSPARIVTDLHLPRPGIGLSWLLSAAVDPGSASFKDRLYVVWADRRSGRVEILFMSSSDRGHTWTSPRVISDDPRPIDDIPRQHAHPTIAVNMRGVVGVTWYDRRDNPDNVGYHVRFRASLDGGDTWLPSVRISEVSHKFDRDEEWAFSDMTSYTRDTLTISRSLRTYWGGHHAGIAADSNGTFHPVWTDNRTGLPQAWTAPVRVRGIVAPHGGGDLAVLRDVSASVDVQMVSTKYARADNLLTVSARLKNKSSQTICGPVYIRALAVGSALGDLTALDADNHLGGAGAVWNFSNTLPQGALVPGEVSLERLLKWSFKSRLAFKPGSSLIVDVLTLQARVLAKTQC